MQAHELFVRHVWVHQEEIGRAETDHLRESRGSLKKTQSECLDELSRSRFLRGGSFDQRRIGMHTL